jgi:hypothetical protein
MTKTKKKPTVYIETSVVSYYTSPVSRDIVIAGHQASTKDFWEELGKSIEPVVSALVFQEASKGDDLKANERIDAIKNISVIDITEETKKLADILIAKKVIPEKSYEDALHIAVAAINKIDFIATWNFKHINNPYTRSKIKTVIEDAGFECPILASPDELLGE